MNKYCFIDTETTGTEVNVHGLVQVAALMVYDGDIMDKIDLNMRPFPDKAFSATALETIGKTREELDAQPNPREQWAMFTSWLQKHVDRYDKLDKFGKSSFV